MTRRTRRGKIAARVLATILSVTMGLSTMSFNLPGAVAFAASETEIEEMAVEAVSEASSEEEDEASADAAAGEVNSETSAAETEENAGEEKDNTPAEETGEQKETDNSEAGAETDAATEEVAADSKDTSEAAKEEPKDESLVSASNYDALVDFATESSEADGIKTTVSKWNFATAANTGAKPVPGDSIKGIIVGGGSGRVYLDAGYDLNVKNNSTAETTGVIYLPVAADTNVVTITITPQDNDSSRYVTVGGFDSDVKLVDNGNDPTYQSVIFKADLKDFVVDNAAGTEGRFIPLYSKGNFKVKAIELVETNATTIVDVSGKVTGEGVELVKGLKFKNETTEEITTCDVVDGAYSVSLPNEFRYVVSVTGTFQYGIDDTDEGNILDLSTGNDKTRTKDFALVALDTVKVSGAVSIAKIDNANPVSADTLKITLVPAKTTLDSVDLELTKGEDDYNYTYTAIILPEEEYSVKLTNANDYECEQKVLLTEDKEVDLEVAAKPLYKVSLEAVTHNMKAVSTVTAVTVKNLDDEYEYSFKDLKGSTLELELRDGLYEVKEITATGSYEPYEHFEVKGEALEEKMYLKDTSVKPAVAYKATVTVGKSGSNYTTIYDALDAIGRMNRTSGQRVTVLLKDEYYQEQVVVDVPDVTFKSELSGGSTISWYYGLGGDKYYSAYLNTEIDKNHLFYDEAHAVDKYESTTIGQTPGNWGSTVNLKSTATGFRAENITFENSFNYYISDVEKADIAESGSILDRTKEGADPTLYSSKERACTMYNRGANNIEFYNCSFISSQDTLYTGDKDEYSYYYNCTIEGTTDFICGDGNAVFDNCDLVLYGFSDKTVPNLVILASKGSATKGYLFNYCTVKADTRDTIQTSNSAYLGRPWGTSDEKVAFMNTILDGDLIQAKGWTTMNTVPSANKGLHEYRTRFTDGTKVELSGRVAANIGSDKEGTADNYVLESEDGYTRTDYLSPDWTPSYYAADYAAVNEQILRYNRLMANEEVLAAATSKQRASLTSAYNAVTTGLFAKDQSKVDAYAANLEKAIDAIAGKQAKEPVSSLKSGEYTYSRVITLSTETAGAGICYTTDGSDPVVALSEESGKLEVVNGTLYTAPIVLSKSATIKAIAFADGYLGSDIVTYEYAIVDPNAGSAGGTFVLESKDLTAFDKGAKADGDSEKAGTDNYFTVIYSKSSSVGSSSKTWEDGYESAQRINLGGVVTTEKNSIAFTTGAAATVKVWWAEGGDDSRQIAILGSDGSVVATTEGDRVKNSAYLSELSLEEAGTYYLGGNPNNNYIFKVEVTEEGTAQPTEYDLQTKDLETMLTAAKADGYSEKAGTDDYFTVIYSAKTKVDSSTKTWEDGYTSSQRLNFGGVASTEKNAISFTTNGAANIKVWWAQGGDDSRQITILGSDGVAVATTTGTWAKNTAYISELSVGAAGTYYLGSAINDNYIFRVTVEELSGAVEKPERGNWADVPAPIISDVTVEDGNIKVTALAYIGYNGADSVTVEMKDEKDDVVATLKSAKEEDAMAKEFTFTPTTSGKYTFIATLSREEEADKVSSESAVTDFVLPLKSPLVSAVTNKGTDANGKGKLEISWSKVNEAKQYDVEVVQLVEEEAAVEESAGEEESKEETGEEAAPKTEKIITEKVVASAKGLSVRETVLSGLPLGEDVIVKVYAVRDKEISMPGTANIKVTGENNRTWVYSSYGSNAKTSDSATVNADGSVSLKTPSSTKIVPGSTDGLGYYYTRMDSSENFTLTAKMRVDAWPNDNGQEGFGLMVADAVGEHGDSAAFWNNSYQAAVTQIQYNWDPTVKDADGNYVGGVTNLTSDSTTIFQEKMRLGIGWIAKSGVTLDQKLKAETGKVTTPSGFTTVSGTLETSVADAIQAQLPGITSRSTPEEVQNAFKNSAIVTKGNSNTASSGSTLNIIDSSKASKSVEGTVVKIGDKEFTDISEVRYQIQRNNTGYVIRYLSLDPLGNESDLGVVYQTDEDGNRISYVGTCGGKNVVSVDGKVYEILSQKIFYDENRNNLTMIDKRYIYVGMFSARKTSATVEEYTLEIVDPDSDYPAEAREYEAVALNTQIISPETSNSARYDLTFNANADGTLTVAKDGKVLAQGMAVTAGKWAVLGSTLTSGNNKFNLVFTPAPGYTPGEYQTLVISKDDPTAKSVSLEYTVKYDAFSGDVIYVAPGAKGDGSKESPASIYDAVSFAAPGQTIRMAGGTYNLGRANGGSNKNVKIDRGTDGTAKKMITLETDPDDVKAGKRAVLDFEDTTGTGSAFVLSGSYWHLKNFDVTNSKNGEKGLHIAGNHNIVEGVNAYQNGNTGIEIARDGNVGRELWPSDNLIKNCTSYLNYDEGFEDADGFAAKITVGDGNRFVGCVAAYNADDGWDLFAKVQSGSIGAVTIEGCMAYKNGYLLGYKNDADYKVFTGADAVEFEAGNGNGFKLGGDGMSGYHVLRDSYAFENKANGIDSNSCPDIQVFNSVSYANATNLALTNYEKSVNSDYTVKGLISIGSSNTTKDSINMLGNQVASKIYNSSNFFWNGSESVNAVDTAVKATKNIFRSTDKSVLGVDVANEKFVNRDANGNIEFGGFLQVKNPDEADNEQLRSVLEYISGIKGGSDSLFTSGSEPTFVVFAKDVKTLRDVESKNLAGEALPEGYEWMNADTATSAYAGTSAEFGIYNKETNATATAIVTFVEVQGVELTPAGAAVSGLFEDDTLVLEATPVYVPEVDDADLVLGRLGFSFKDKKNMGLIETVSGNTVSLRRFAASKEGIASYTATMQYTAGGKTYKLTSPAYSFSTRVNDFTFKYKLTGAASMDAATGTITLEKAGDKFKLEGLEAVGVGAKTGVKVAVGDSRILKYSKGEFTAVRSGATYITLTASADATAQTTLLVKVKGKAFAVVASTLTVDKAKNDGVSFVVSKQADAELEDVSVSKVLKGTSEKADLKDMFEVKKVIANAYTISIKPDTDEEGNETSKAPKIPNGTYTLVLTSGKNEFEPLTVVVKETIPYASIRQTKAVNLFYKAGTTGNTGTLKVTSGQGTPTVKLASESDFNLSSSGSSYDIIMTNAAQDKINSGARLNRNIKLTVSFDGYKKAYNRTYNHTVATRTTAPRYKLELGSSVLYTELGIRDTELKVLNRDTGEYLTDADITLASSRASYVRANKNFTLDEEAGVYTIAAAKSGTAKISIIDPDFSKDPATKYTKDREIILDAPISVSTRKPYVSIAAARLNGQAGFAAYSSFTSRVNIYNATDYTLRNFTLTGNNKKSVNILPFLDYSFGKDLLGRPVVTVSFKDSADKTIDQAIAEGIIRNGSYSFTANFAINKLQGRKAQFALTVMSNARATGSVSGSIDLANRTGSYAKVTPNVYNLEGTVTGMYFKGAENLFDVQWDQAKGRGNVYAKEDASYRANRYYKVTPVYTVATAKGEFEVTSSPVNIYVKQSRLTLSRVPVIEVKLSDIAQSGMATVSATAPKNAAIASMQQLTETDKFNVSFDDMSGNLYVDIANVKGLKEGRTYTVRMGITPEGNGAGISSQTFNVRVRVIR